MYGFDKQARAWDKHLDRLHIGIERNWTKAPNFADYLLYQEKDEAASKQVMGSFFSDLVQFSNEALAESGTRTRISEIHTMTRNGMAVQNYRGVTTRGSAIVLVTESCGSGIRLRSVLRPRNRRKPMYALPGGQAGTNAVQVFFSPNC